MKILILLSLVALSSCCSPTTTPRPTTTTTTKVHPKFLTKMNINKFTVDLYNKLSEEENGNLVFSPFSVHTALSMALEGSPTESRTFKQLATAINGRQAFNQRHGIQKVQSDYTEDSFVNHTIINVANKAFIDDSFQMKNEYNEVLKTFYNSSIQTVDYAQAKEAADTINGFVSDATNDMIKELVSEDDFDADTRMTLINAIYFKDNWKMQFDEKRTRPMMFNGQQFDDGMNLKAEFRWADMKSQGLDAQILEMPYENENFRMLLVLPHKNVQDLDLQYFDGPWQTTLEEKFLKEKVNVQLPKFKMEPPVKSLKQALENMGAVDMFKNPIADFSEISDEALHVKDVLHQAVVEVNEEGSEAAAATAVIMQARMMVMEKEMIFDKPFIFLIEDKANGIPLFLGRVMDVSSLKVPAKQPK